MHVGAALEYSRKHAGETLLAVCAGETIADDVTGDLDPNAAHPLYSGTKSFWGPLAMRAREDGLLDLDERVADTIVGWRADPRKRRVTLRMLLWLTAGFGFGGLGNAVPAYERALNLPLKHEPGTTFAYGGIALQVFGAVLARKLAPHRTPHDYLRERLLEPAGVRVARWRTLTDATHPLPTGASLAAREWLTYGRFILRQRSALDECFAGSPANPRYGLGWWLAPAGVPNDLVYASGAGGQGLYLVPSLDLAIVRFGRSASYKHETFLKRLLPA